MSKNGHFVGIFVFIFNGLDESPGFLHISRYIFSLLQGESPNHLLLHRPLHHVSEPAVTPPVKKVAPPLGVKGFNYTNAVHFVSSHESGRYSRHESLDRAEDLWVADELR